MLKSSPSERKLKSASLPSKFRMGLVLAVCTAWFLLFEFVGFPRNLYSSAEKLRLLRCGIMAGYLSALIGGCAFYWSAKAARIIDQSSAAIKHASSHIYLLRNAVVGMDSSHQKQIAHYEEEIAHCKMETETALKYQKSNSWLGYVALFGIFISALLQMLGSTGTE